MSERVCYVDLDRGYGPKKVFNVIRTSFIVGVNMPWGDFCGHDFGLQPYGWGEKRNDWGKIGEELKALAADGVTVVRWWLLGGGVNYPNRNGSPGRSADAQGRVRQAIEDHADRVRPDGQRLAADDDQSDFEWVWREPQRLPPLSDAFIDDFIELCRACQNAGVQLLPSLLSFEWFDRVEERNKGVYSGGRRRLVFGRGGDSRASVRRFLASTLQPLLAKATEVFGRPKKMCAPGEPLHPIFAWEVINEPDWVVQGGPPGVVEEKRVSPGDMNVLLEEARRMVLVDSQDGYDFSIGFKAFDPTWLSARLRKMLTGDGTRYWHQGHHYPTAGFDSQTVNRFIPMDRTLPRAPADFVQCLVGELPTAKGNSREDVHLTDAVLADAVQGFHRVKEWLESLIGESEADLHVFSGREGDQEA